MLKPVGLKEEKEIEAFILERRDNLEVKYTDIQGPRLEQVVVRDGRELKWTVVEDRSEKWYNRLREELQEVSSYPPIFGMDFGNAGLVAARKGNYTMVLGANDLDLVTLVETFKEIVLH